MNTDILEKTYVTAFAKNSQVTMAKIIIDLFMLLFISRQVSH